MLVLARRLHGKSFYDVPRRHFDVLFVGHGLLFSTPAGHTRLLIRHVISAAPGCPVSSDDKSIQSRRST
jgi:hypothetical protein